MSNESTTEVSDAYLESLMRTESMYATATKALNSQIEANAALHAQISTLQEGLRKEIEAGITLETQNRIRDLVIKKSGAGDGVIDGSGCDSGDPVDLTLAEIAQGFNYLLDEVIEPLKKELAGAKDEIRRTDKMRW